ncbi:hypothetical protein [Elizabethkingia meningoseptica]|uniref:hypothetical protein n=1 Tax=Elizabethkingia meningoseptica TaxID=238 RepID=UPI003892382F
MTRTRIVKQNYTKISAKGHSMYSRENIVSSAGKSIREKGDEKGEKHGNPKNPPKKKGIIDIVMFVAGTTDPINKLGLKHEANTHYWQGKNDNFWAKIKDLKPKFINLNIEGEFFSWSGDNDTSERIKASKGLLGLLLRVYRFWTNDEVHLHLIGHSHGGNVINQFTEYISKSKDYPKEWKIKSITYLSTPFFKKKHQLNHSKLHPNCKIINVHNEYDLTQRLIADFSLLNMEVFLKNFQLADFGRGMKTLESVDTSAFHKLHKPIINNKTDGPFLWREMAKSLAGINQLTQEFVKYIEGLPLNNKTIAADKAHFVTLIKRFQHWTFERYNVFYNNRSGRSGGYGRSEFMEDLRIATAIEVLNDIFQIEKGVKDSYVLTFLAKLFSENAGITDSIEINSWSPKLQTKGLKVVDINITDKDPYHSRNKKVQCESFITGAVKALEDRNLEEVLMRLFSQFVTPFVMKAVYYLLDALEFIVTGELDTQIKRLRRSVGVYGNLVKQYHADLVTKDDAKNIKDMPDRPGSVPYLALASHSLSHTQFWEDVKTELESAFSSGRKSTNKVK